MTVWIGVFATTNGWRLAGPFVQQRYLDRNEAISAAIHLALLVEWRGEEAGVLAQATSWGELSPVDLRAQRNRLRPFH